MTVQQDLQKAIAAAQSALGTYATFAQSTQDQTAKQMFQELSQDAQRHIEVLNGRLQYLNQNNSMNQQTTT
ncbi:DUF1657 domain-containing protein [Paradesulfitobacterium ferrireducens]|uniref:DUF1657 domain-containing protein n=1 Tax=Paradesulfitobacterium ferrireducens TaxID=2816476 RepID=UPI001A8F4950|nr:DUF1657 domain-containing protein [Paradesulfitobacterium ferrireducens]